MSRLSSSVSGQLKVGIKRISGLTPLKVTDFINFSSSSTPGNVAVCLSGGGSRAMTAGMGQLCGLKALGLLDKTKAISTVSGGSWVGTTFEFNGNAQCSDDDYLGKYITPPALTSAGVNSLSEKNIGYRCTEQFSIFDLAFQAFKLYYANVPTHMLWQTLIGNHILDYYNLFEHDANYTPTSLFSNDQTTLQKDVVSLNPSLKNETANLIASGSGRVRRPYLVCNMAMFVETPGTGYHSLVPVQCTPFFTGIISTPPDAKDFNGKLVGGGYLTSFAFNSDLNAVDPSNIYTVNQSRQFALMDAVGISSAAFAEKLENLFKDYMENPMSFLEDAQKYYVALQKRGSKSLTKAPDDFTDLMEKISRIDVQQLKNKVGALKDADVKNNVFAEIKVRTGEDVEKVLSVLTFLIPTYKYWPILNAAVNPNVITTNFADAGSLDNTGINAMLTYSDIDKIIAFVNTSSPMKSVDHGVIGSNGKEIPGTNIFVDSQIPPLFGYQPYDDSNGYVLYPKGGDPSDLDSPEFRFNQVFPPEAFPDLLKNLWTKRGGSNPNNTYGSSVSQALTTVDNSWFGVKGGRKIQVLWCYNGSYDSWYNSLSQDVRNIVNGLSNFPYYDTFTQLELDYPEINMLANLSAWNVVEGNKQLFLDMYK